MALEMFNLTLQSAKMLSPNTRHLAFKREDGNSLSFIPGQFITFLFDCDGVVKRRSYSLANTSQQGDLEIAISYVKGGVASEKLFALKPGESVLATGPAGRLILQPGEAGVKRYVLVGTGTGIAPYRAMASQIQALAKQGIQFVILQGVQYRQDLLYGDDFLALAREEANVEFHAFYSREDLAQLTDVQSHEHKGYVQTGFNHLQLNPAQDVVYLCGNPNMIDDAYALLTAQGFNPKSVRREKYISSN
jgi:ferredoxin-NADP reductase